MAESALVSQAHGRGAGWFRNRAHECWKTAGAGALLLASLGFLYRDVVTSLVRNWSGDQNYSHGFFIVPVALFFAWERRQKFLAAARRPCTFGLSVVLLSTGALIAGELGAELFMTRISLLGFVAGALLFLYGWEHLRIMLFPIVFLMLMIPVPAILFNQIAFPLQLLASQSGETALAALHVPVLREGNLIHLSETSLEVAEACSGIRSLISLLTIGIMLGYFTESRIWARTVLALATVPVAIVVNGLRVAATGVAAYRFGPRAAEGFLHAFSGWMIFLAAFVLLFALQRLLAWCFPKTPEGMKASSKPE